MRMSIACPRATVGALAIGLVAGLAAATAPAGATPTARSAEPGALPACLGERMYPAAVADEVMAGVLRIEPWGPTRLPRDIDWSASPFGHPSWEVRFRTLRWVDPLVNKAIDPGLAPGQRSDYRQRATQILRDFIADNPRRAPDPLRFTWDGTSAVAKRAEGLLCFQRAFPRAAWLQRSLAEHVRYLVGHWSGAWNHGTMEAITLYRLGCLTGDREIRGVARQRLLNSFAGPAPGPVLDAQGATNEQAIDYAYLQYRLWTRAAETMRGCGDRVPRLQHARTALVPAFLAAATQPDGRLVQIGDTTRHPVPSMRGTATRYVASAGTDGPHPGRRVSVFDAGYVFGRSGWGQTRDFAQESFYSLRFGPARQLHGHHDHQAVTYFARGRSLLVDSGHTGYRPGRYRDYLRSPAAHNVMEILGVPHRAVATTLVRRSGGPTWRFFKVTDAAYGVRQTRSVLVAQEPDLMMVYDRTGDIGTARTFRQLWHLDPRMRVRVRAGGIATATAADGGNLRLWMIPVAFPGQRMARAGTDVVEGARSPMQGWVSYRLLHRRPAPVVRMAERGRRAQKLTVLVPTARAAEVTATMRRGHGGAAVLTVWVDDQRLQFLVGAQGNLQPRT